MNKLRLQQIHGDPTFIGRIEKACDTTLILWSSEGRDDGTLFSIMMMLVERGVSLTWLLFGRGLFWERHNAICDN